MRLDWSSVQREHVAEACAVLAKHPRLKVSKGLYVMLGDRKLPVKDVLRLAYCIAHGMPDDTHIAFASGESSLNRLRRLGFVVGRIGAKATEANHGR
jgi:hypothetical protein